MNLPKENSSLNKIIASCVENDIPRIKSGSGEILSLIATLVHAQNILEIGTGSGYSAVYLASRLEKKVSIVTIEKDKRVFHIARRNVENTPYAANITCINSDALLWLQNHIGTYDFIFVDGKKSEYHLYLKQCYSLLKKGGAIVFDDVLFSPTSHAEKNMMKQIYIMLIERRLVRYFTSFNRSIMRDSRFRAFFIPIENGLCAGIKA